MGKQPQERTDIDRYIVEWVGVWEVAELVDVGIDSDGLVIDRDWRVGYYFFMKVGVVEDVWI